MNTTILETHASTTADDGFTVLDACHQRTLAMLDELSLLVARLDHGGVDERARAQAAKIAGFFSTTARQHHEDEERHVFPPLVEGGDPQVVQTVLRLQQDHGWLEEDWFELAPHVQAIAAGFDWYDIDVLREGVAVFSALSRDHIELEESLIYPAARERVRDEQRRDMGREMAARHHAERASRRHSRT